MWTYAVALAPNIRNKDLHSKDYKIKIIDSLEVKVIYTIYDDPKEAIVRAVSQKLYEGGNDPDGLGMDGWARMDLEKTTVEELIEYYQYSGKGIHVSVPVKVPEND